MSKESTKVGKQQQSGTETRMTSSELFVLTHGALVVVGLDAAQTDIRQIIEIIAKNALKVYLGVTAQFAALGNEENEFSLKLDSNPLVEFVEVPEDLKGLRYSQAICGCIRGALEALHMDVQAVLVSDVPEPTELRIKVHRVLQESIPAGDEF